MMRHPKFELSDCVVFRKWKQSPHPGPRAKGIIPTPRGENYVYFVEKIWRVAEVLDDGSLLLKTRRGKVHSVRPDDPNLRRMNFADRIRYRSFVDRLRESERDSVPTPER